MTNYPPGNSLLLNTELYIVILFTYSKSFKQIPSIPEDWVQFNSLRNNSVIKPTFNPLPKPYEIEFIISNF